MKRQSEQLKLDVDNVRAYLANKKLPFELKNLIKVEEIGEYSNNNYIFRLKIRQAAAVKYYYLKQAQSFNRRSLQQGKPIAVSPARMQGEVWLIRKFNKSWGHILPQLYFFDRFNNIMLVSDVAVGKQLLIDKNRKNKVHPEIAQSLGGFLANIHTATFLSRAPKPFSKQWHKVMLWFFNDHLGYGARKHLAVVRVNTFYKEVMNSRVCMIWGDPVHRNIFVGNRKSLGLIDFDHTIRYDPMVDVSMLLAHWVWMWLKGGDKLQADCELFMKDFSREYWSVWKECGKLPEAAILKMQQRLLRWLGVYLLSRTDGKSGSYFKNWPKWEKRIRNLGCDLFQEKHNKNTGQLLELIVH